MKENNTKIFREKSLERVTSPEQLDSYIKVVNPAIWIVFSAIAVLLIGAIIFCAVFKLETKTVKSVAVVKNNEVTLYIAGADRQSVSSGMTVHIANSDYLFPEGDMDAVKLFTATDSAITSVIGTTDEEYAYKIKFYADIPNGVYTCSIVANEVTPLSLLLN